MNVKKNVLEQKSNYELDEYIKEKSRFTPQAINYAFEILKSRGKEFSEEQIEMINSQINAENFKSEVIIHPNEIKASNLILASAGLGFINMFFSPEVFISSYTIFVGIMTIGIIISLGIAVRKGIQWVKYLLLTLIILGLFNIPLMIKTLQYNLLANIINIIQSVLQILSVVFLFLTREKK